jgi:hypothetical protein
VKYIKQSFKRGDTILEEMSAPTVRKGYFHIRKWITSDMDKKLKVKLMPPILFLAC